MEVEEAIARLGPSTVRGRASLVTAVCSSVLASNSNRTHRPSSWHPQVAGATETAAGAIAPTTATDRVTTPAMITVHGGTRWKSRTSRGKARTRQTTCSGKQYYQKYISESVKATSEKKKRNVSNRSAMPHRLSRRNECKEGKKKRKTKRKPKEEERRKKNDPGPRPNL